MATSQNKMGDKPDEASAIKRKLVWRMGIAGMMIVGLLGGLALFDHFNTSTPIQPEAPQFTEPVPVQQKMTTQPVTPATPVESTPSVEPAAEPESSTTPEQSGATLPATPPPPIVAAQPSLPRANQSAGREAPANPAPAKRTERAESAAEPSPVAPKAAEPEIAKPVASTATPPAPARLMSGYALQAGVFADTQHAEDLLAKLTQAGIAASIEARVQVGPFKTRQEADAARKKLNALGIDSILLPPGRTRR